MSERPRHPSYDIFVSYDPRDTAFVQQLSRRLSTDGFQVWLDVWELVPGAPSTSEIERAVAESLVFAACLGASASPRVETELELTRKGEPDGRPPRVIAILLPGAQVPATLADLPVVDLREGISREALDLLTTLVSAARQETATARGTGNSAPSQIDYRRVLDHVDAVLREDPSNVDALRTRAFASAALGRREEAAEALERLAVLVPDDPTLLTTRIPLLVSLHRSHEVPVLVRSAEVNAPRIVDEMARAIAGMSDAEIARYTEASGGFGGLTDKNAVRRLIEALRTDRERALRILRAEFASLEALALADSTDTQIAAASAWRRAIAMDPERTLYRLQLVQALTVAGRLDELDRELAGWATATGPVAPLARAWSALRREQAEEALSHLSAAIAMNPLDPIPKAIRGDLLVGMGRFAEGAEDLRAVWESNTSNSPLLSRLLAVYRMLGKLDDEADLMDAWADNAEPIARGFSRLPGGSVRPDAPWVKDLDSLLASGEMAAQQHALAEMLRIQARLREGRSDEAFRLARRAVSRWPRQYAPWAAASALLPQIENMPPVPAPASDEEPAWVEPVWQALVALARNEPEQASTRIQQVLNESSDVGVVHWLHGSALEAGHQLDGALAAFTRAIEIDRHSPSPLFSRANVLQELGRPEEALADLDVALDDLQAGSEQEMYFTRGEVRRALGRYRQAIEDFDRALTIPARNPGMPAVVIGSRGQAKLGLSDFEGALHDLNAALEQKPDMVWALISRATVHLARRDVDSAVVDRQRVVALLPDDSDAWAAYGMMLLETRQPETLWTELSEAANADRALLDVPSVRNLLAEAAIATGRFAEAEEHFHANTELDPNEPLWRYEEARAVRHQGRMDEARALVERTLEQQPISAPDAATDFSVRAARCVYLLAAGHEREAEEEWRSVLSRVDDPELLSAKLEQLDALEASGLRSPAIRRIRSSIQAKIGEVTPALAG